MILPIRTSIRPQRTPYVNYALIIINVIIFFLTYAPHKNPYTGHEEVLRVWANQFMLNPARPFLWQFITYAFLHGGLMHIFGNMYFLYLFGNNVNDKFGNINYLSLYLGGAVFAGVGHSLFHTNPVLGASGAIAAITGAYLVLFPQTLITILYWFFFIGTMEIPALYFIGFKLIVWDNVIEPNFAPSAVAYGAHLAGYGFGIAAVLLGLATGLVSGGGLDLWTMIRQWNRRRRYRNVVSAGYEPFTGHAAARPIRVKQIQKTPAQKQTEDEILQLRNRISDRIAQRNLPAATEAYLELMKLDHSQIISRQNLLDVANQLAGENKPAESAHAYEQFLAHYSAYEHIEQVQLMLGILYSRYLNKPKQAVKHLKAAAKKLSDPGQLSMCKEELAKLSP